MQSQTIYVTLLQNTKEGTIAIPTDRDLLFFKLSLRLTPYSGVKEITIVT